MFDSSIFDGRAFNARFKSIRSFEVLASEIKINLSKKSSISLNSASGIGISSSTKGSLVCPFLAPIRRFVKCYLSLSSSVTLSFFPLYFFCLIPAISFYKNTSP